MPKESLVTAPTISFRSKSTAYIWSLVPATFLNPSVSFALKANLKGAVS